MIRQAVVLTAGLATRMRPLTETTAKPLLTLAGRALLDHALDRLLDAGVNRIVVNAHWHADRVAAHLAGRPGVTVLREDALLGTGGTLREALRNRTLLDAPFYVVNGDSYWLDGPTPALLRVGDALLNAEAPGGGEGCDDAIDGGCDGVLLVHRTFQIQAEVGCGDFALDPWGVPRRGKEREIVPYIFAGVQALSPRLLDLMRGGEADGGPLESLVDINTAWDAALAAGRLRAVVHDGLWFHLSRPADLADAEEALRAGAVGETR